MKARESGMPGEKIWEQFFDVEKILSELEVNNKIEKLVDFGFGYGTFTIPASRKIKGIVYAYDIEEALTKELESKLEINNIHNVNLDNYFSGRQDWKTAMHAYHLDRNEFSLKTYQRTCKFSVDLRPMTSAALKRRGLSN